MRDGRRESWAKWQGLVSEQTGSGQTVAAFCRERRLTTSQFFAWKRRLRQEAAAPFVEVQVEAVQALAPSPKGSAIEIRFPGGHSIFVEPGFDASHLRAVVAALEART